MCLQRLTGFIQGAVLVVVIWMYKEAIVQGIRNYRKNGTWF